jgi:diamine N-acetyltransferase
MIELRTLNAVDVVTIQNWPPYPPEFTELDYALRSNGWLAEYRNRPDTWIYIAEQAGEIIAFTTLARTGDTEAEFRIALRADMIGQKLGVIITAMTLDKGFAEFNLACIHLIARRNNPRAIRLYQRLGFTEHGECMMNINGKQVHFLRMEIARASYAEHSG